MKKAFAFVSILLTIGTVVAACGNKSSGHGSNTDLCDAYGCYGTQDGVLEKNSYGYVGPGTWKGSMTISDQQTFQLMMQSTQRMACFRAPCFPMADYMKAQIKLPTGELPESSRVAYRVYANGFNGGTAWLPGTAFSLGGGNLGFRVLHTLNTGVYQANIYSTAAAKANQIEFRARFRDQSHGVIFVVAYFAGKEFARGELFDREQYRDDAGSYVRRKKIVKRRVIGADDRVDDEDLK